MTSLEIKKGQTESEPYVLAHKVLGAVFVPGSVGNDIAEVWGGHDGTDYGPIYAEGKLTVLIAPRYSVTAFDSTYFNGIQYIKLVLDKLAAEDLIFYLHVQEA